MSQSAARTTKGHGPEAQVAQSNPAGPPSTDQMAEQLRAKHSHMVAGDPAPVPATAKPMRAAEVVVQAMKELAHISGLQADHVSSVACEPDGWHVTVDLIELKRIPASTDVIAAYDAVFAPDGSLLSYHRRRRYFRDQMTEDQ
ncbi:gas vesicle protein GvpO [Hyphomicrobium sp.]|uniref:gas vesicle protein GvpO n=1 Tax=Hyphomicrobium sp. TaxID=82 RepID=UPI0022CAF377|nr:gas vesicle protein GvpO [Hyphomicrobium sp.]MCZ7596148.1 gas vesicle protein [Hyphomicrobium sp.]